MYFVLSFFSTLFKKLTKNKISSTADVKILNIDDDDHHHQMIDGWNEINV